VWSEDDLPVAPISRRRRMAYDSDEDEDKSPNPRASQSQQRNHGSGSASHSANVRGGSSPPPMNEAISRPSKKKATGKAKSKGPPTKKTKKKRSVVTQSSEESDFSEGVQESDDQGPESEEEYSDILDEPGPRKPKGKGKGAAAQGGKSGGGRKGAAAKDVPIKAKDEGARARSSSAPLHQGSSRTAPKATRGTGKRRQSPGADEMDIDVIGDSQPTRSSGTSPLPEDKGAKHKQDGPIPTVAAVKRTKLPTIKKTKIEGGAEGSKSAVSGSVSADHKAKSVLDELIPTGPASAPRLAAARQGATDLDLNNSNVYAELFKARSSPIP